MSQIPLTEGNLQSLQRSQQYGSNVSGGADPNSLLMTSGLHALMDGPAGNVKDSSSAPYLGPEDANSIVANLLRQYYHVQEWQVPWPRPKSTPLLYVPDAITEAFDVPKVPTLADLDAMSLGIVDAIPLAHDLMFPEQERARSQLSRRVDEAEAEAAQIGLHSPYQSAKERNKDLDDEDFALIDVDFCASGHGQRHLPSITFLLRPSYTEIGLAPAERREEERRHSIAQPIAPPMAVTAAAASQQQQQYGGAGSLPSAADLLAGGGTSSSQQLSNPQLSQWNATASRTFKYAKQLDVCYNKWISDAALLKLGLVEVHNGSLTAEVIARLTTRILNLVAYITANGVVLGAKRNDTNQSFYNTQQGKFVGAIVWRHLCALAAEAWGYKKQKDASSAASSAAVPALLNLAPSTIANRILDDAHFDDLALGSEETKALLHDVLSDVIEAYTIALKQSVGGNSKMPCPLVHTPEDYVSFTGLGAEVLPESVKLVSADASTLAQRKQSAEYEREVQRQLCLATNVALHPTLAKIAEAGETSRRTSHAHLGQTPVDHDLISVFRSERVASANGAVPLSVMPVFPEGFERIAADPTAPAHTFNLANAHRGLQHVVLNGERNSFVPGAYVPTDLRSPSVLFNERLFFRPVEGPVDVEALLEEATAKAAEGSNPAAAATVTASAALLGAKRNRRGGSAGGSSNAATAGGASDALLAETTAYTTGTTHSKYEKYLADQASTISYVLKVSDPSTLLLNGSAAAAQQHDEDTRAALEKNFAASGPIVTYSRIPILTRYKRAQARLSADDVLKTVTVSWSGNEDEAKMEQLELVEAENYDENDEASQ